MGSSLGSYEIARSGMYVSERGLFVTGHNISNANTVGYSRQQAIIETSSYTKEGYKYQIGLGADIQQTRQIREQYLDNVYRKEVSTLGYWQARNKTFEDVQAVLGEPMGDGLQNGMNEFWDSWQELSKDPTNLSLRAIVKQKAEDIANQINHIGDQLDTMQKDLDRQISDCIDEVNDITDQIAKLNVKIAQNEVAGDKANDYRDQRAVLVERLSAIANTDVTEMQGGQLYITIGGYAVVDKEQTTKLFAGRNLSSPTGLFLVPKFQGSGIDVPLKNGTLKGLLDARGYEYNVPGTSGGNVITDKSVSVSGLKQMLNDLVYNLAEQVNKTHQNGYGLDGTHGVDFFKPIDATKPIGAGNIKYNDMLSLDQIAAASSTSYGDPTNAGLIANLRHNAVMKDLSGKVDMDTYYRTIIRGVGNSGAEAKSAFQSQLTLVQSVDSNRQSISGVSMDEEMSNMMKFQFAYNASSRAINAIDQMIDTIINRLGLVGR